jgi:sn-glycerol 3-phosphate transport system permease protein
VGEPGRPALIIAIGKISISMLSAFAIVYFRFPGGGCSSG